MDYSLQKEPWVTRESYAPVFRAIFLVIAAFIAAVTLGFTLPELVDANNSALRRLGAGLELAVSFLVAYGLWRSDFELRVDDKVVSARLWPFPSVVVPIDQVVSSEVVEIRPFRDYWGWGIKGTRRDMLIGGKGTRALRITYIHKKSGKERKLTILTGHADQAEQLIARVPSV